MSDLISRSALMKSKVFLCGGYVGDEYARGYMDALDEVENEINNQPQVEPVRGEWVYWKEQCEYCMNRNTCPYTENQESIKSLKQWEKENKFWGSLKLICDYYVLDKDKYYLDNPPECSSEG